MQCVPYETGDYDTRTVGRFYFLQLFVQDWFWKIIHMFSEDIFDYWPFNKLTRHRTLQKIMELIHYHGEAARYITCM